MEASLLGRAGGMVGARWPSGALSCCQCPAASALLRMRQLRLECPAVLACIRNLGRITAGTCSPRSAPPGRHFLPHMASSCQPPPTGPPGLLFPPSCPLPASVTDLVDALAAAAAALALREPSPAALVAAAAQAAHNAQAAQDAEVC